MTARWPFRAALGFVIGYQIVGPLIAGEHVRWGW